MSVQAITWALDYPARSVTEKVILLVLANYANEHGVSWPSQRTLAGQSACTDRTVRTVLAQLERRGVIRRIARRRGNGSRQSDMILLEAFGAPTPAAPGTIDEGGDPPPDHVERLSAGGLNRNALPGGTRNELPHPPEGRSALDPSKTLRDSTPRAHSKLEAACLAVAGPGLGPNRLHG